MTKRIYKAPLGATSITVNGSTFEVDGQGRIECDDESAHADLLSHGYTYGDAPATAAVVDPADFERALASARDELSKHAASLDEREATLREVGESLATREAELGKRAADLAARETDLTMRAFAVDQREAALGAVTPPPPPPVEAAAKATKAKG